MSGSSEIFIFTSLHLPVATRDFLKFIKPLENIKEKLFIMDKGFYSAENIKYLLGKEASYIIPLISNTELCKDAVQPGPGRIPQFIYSAGHKTDLVEYQESEDAGKRAIFFTILLVPILQRPHLLANL